MKNRILFVDDEPQILQGLRRMLHRKSQDWELHFASSGAEALELMAQTPMDVVVSDMLMPGMDGVHLLGEVKELYPKTARIALSGHMGQEMSMASTKVAHQFLTKPCSPDDLISVLGRILTLRAYLNEESLRCLAAGMEQIPSLPDLYISIQEELDSSQSSLKKLGEIIARDLGMSAKILQLVNSSFFGLYAKVSSPAQAVNLLGTETVKVLVLYVHVFSSFNPRKCPGFSLAKLSRHSMAVAALARELADMEGVDRKTADNAYLAGMMHDVGRLLFAVNIPDLYDEILSLDRDKRKSLWETEQEVLGANHAQVGAYLMGLWGMNDPVVEAIGFHHCPSKSTAPGFTPLTAVHVANVLSQEDIASDSDFDLSYLKQCGLLERLDAWKSRALTLQEAFGDVFLASSTQPKIAAQPSPKKGLLK